MSIDRRGFLAACAAGAIDRLEKQGLVRRSVLPEDRRSVLVRLTAKGRRVATSVHGELAALEGDILAHIGGGAKAGAADLPAALERVGEAAAFSATRRSRGQRCS
jgi:DNA-binding MarR family transcriptional regulator